MKTAIGVLCVFSGLLASVFAEDRIVWSLGKPDASAAEFQIPYHAWEYGNAPEIQKSDNMDFKTRCFNYEIAGDATVSKPEIPQGLITEAVRSWMQDDEIVSALKLSWLEAESGMRKLELDLVDWRNMEKGRDGYVWELDRKGIELSLPDGGKRIFNPPASNTLKKGEVLKFSAIFPVKAGSNSLTVRIASMVKHYGFKFDYVALSKTDAKCDAKPILEGTFDSDGAIYHPGEDATFSVSAFNIPDGKGEVSYSVKNAFGKEVASGKLDLKDGKSSVKVPTAVKGWFSVEATLDGYTAKNSYVSIEPSELEYVDDSRFGCHAVLGDGYRPRHWSEAQESIMRKAFMAGAKWARYHRLSWEVVEPEKGNYDFKFVDAKMAVAEKYKMRVMVNFGDVAKWASSKPEERKLTICGTPRYTQFPPKDLKDWSDFVETVVRRYSKQVKWYELWNEPGYQSAFWCNGSASDFGKLLKAGYEGAKKGDPDCVTVSGAPLSPPDFFEEVVKSCGGKRYFDVMSLHYLNNGKRGAERFASWKSALDKMGAGSLPIINSEEMHWPSDDGSSLSIASKLLKLYVREAALGIEKTFAFDFFQNGSSYGVSAFDYSGSPLSQYAAYRTMTHRLEHAKFVADLSSSETEAYLFDRQGTPVIALWSDKSGEATLPLGSSTAKAIDIMDVETPLRSADGTFRLKVSSIPSFIEGGELAALKAYAEAIRALPGEIVCKPGSSVERAADPKALGVAPKLALPEGWKGSLKNGKLRLAVPASASEGVYDAKAELSVDGRKFAIPFLVDVRSGALGANLLRNGDFKEGERFWFFPKDKGGFAIAKGEGLDGGNAAMTKGPVFFGCAGGIKVRPGEKYALVATARGEGLFGGVYTLLDKDGRTVFPKKNGINCLVGRLGPSWRTYSDVITIDEADAALLKFAALANHGDKDGKTAFFGDFTIMRLSDSFTLAKAAHQGVCANLPADWSSIPAMTLSDETGLKASCRLAMDAGNLHMQFVVKDSKGVYAPAGSDLGDAWRFDSIQFAIDPTLEGKDRTEILIARDVSGKAHAYKHANFWTPELPENITRRGLLKDAKAVAKEIEGGMEYTVKIPLYELYPLSGGTKEFGFSWLVNDDDGEGRKYVEWAGGIGGKKDASLFGLVRRPEDAR